VEMLAQKWFECFMETVQCHEAASELRDAAIKGSLRLWTKALTDVVVSTFDSFGWKGAAKGHRSDFLPVARQEYLSLDAVAFETDGKRIWRFPVAVFELENSRSDDVVAYSLWKVLCTRAPLKVVFCYRKDAEEGSSLVRTLAKQVVRGMSIPERQALSGETMIVVGSRNEATTFPYGFFKDWNLDVNTARFCRA